MTNACDSCGYRKNNNMGDGRFSWSDARIIANHYFQFWEDGEDLLWAKFTWAIFEKKGMTIYYNGDEETKARSLVALLALFYQEALCRTGIDTYKALGDDRISEIFEDSYDVIEERLIKIRDVIAGDYKNEAFSFRMFLTSVYSGERAAIDPATINDAINDQMLQADIDEFSFGRALSFYRGSSLHPINFESIPFMPKDKG